MDFTYPNIYRLIDVSSSFRMLSFMVAFSGYNHIRMIPRNSLKIKFLMNHSKYYYDVMPFVLNNVRVTYHGFIDNVFSNQIGWNLE